MKQFGKQEKNIQYFKQGKTVFLTSLQNDKTPASDNAGSKIYG